MYEKITYYSRMSQTLHVPVPVTGGLAINYVLKSQAFDTIPPWAIAASVIINANEGVAPDGTSTADSIVSAAAAPFQYVQQQTVTIAGTYTFSIYAKPRPGSTTPGQWVALSVFDTAHHFCWFDTLNGVTGTTDASCTTSIAAAANGYYRCVLTYTPTVDNSYVHIEPTDGDNTNNYTPGSGDPALYMGQLLWGAQYETGSSATTYNPNL